MPFAEQTAEGGSLVGKGLPELEKDALVLVEQLLQDVDVSSLNIDSLALRYTVVRQCKV
jgi:hypothetical protein